MSSTRIGAGLNLKQQNSGSPEVERSVTGDIVTRKFNILRSRVKAVTDAETYGTADGEYTDSVLTKMISRPVGATNAELTYTYEPSADAEVVGTVIQEIDSNPIDIPVGDAKEGLSAAVIAAKKKEGIEAILRPQPIYRRTEILASFTFSEANAINDVGKIDNTPAGLTSPTAGKWLKVGFVVRTAGAVVEQAETWQYAENGWDTDFYSSIA